MHSRRRWLIVPIIFGAVAPFLLGMRGGAADDSKRTTAEDVVELWKPRPEGVQDYQQWMASPVGSPGVAAATFRVVGPSFEDLWNFYAGLCGVPDRYKAKNLLVSGKTGPKGSYVVADRASLESGERTLSVFLLRTDRHSLTVTIRPDVDGKAMLGSIAVVIP